MLDNINSSLEEQVSMFLHVVGHNQRFRVVHQIFRRFVETICRHFRQVLYAVRELRNEMIKPPNLETHPKILGSQRWNPFFKVPAHFCRVHCRYLNYLTQLSKINLTVSDLVSRITLGQLMAPMCCQTVPRHMQGAFRGRKSKPTQNVVAIVDFDLKFTCVLAGWEDSTHDALILADAIERDDGLSVLEGNSLSIQVILLCT